MNGSKNSNKSKPVSSQKQFLVCFLFSSLFLFSSFLFAQSSSHNGGQWASVGGEMVASGSGHFSNQWWAAGRYNHGDGKYWLNDERKSDKTTGKKIPATHTPEEVNKDVWRRKGQVTVVGPGYLGLFMRSKGAGAALKFPKSGKVFYTLGLGKDEWLTGSDQKKKWYPGSVVNVDPNQRLNGWVPEGRTTTLDVWVYNPHSEWGIWGNGFGAPTSLEYEFWFFPREGGKVISSASIDVPDANGNLPDFSWSVETTPPIDLQPISGKGISPSLEDTQVIGGQETDINTPIEASRRNLQRRLREVKAGLENVKYESGKGAEIRQRLWKEQQRIEGRLEDLITWLPDPDKELKFLLKAYGNYRKSANAFRDHMIRSNQLASELNQLNVQQMDTVANYAFWVDKTAGYIPGLSTVWGIGTGTAALMNENYSDAAKRFGGAVPNAFGTQVTLMSDVYDVTHHTLSNFWKRTGRK